MDDWLALASALMEDGPRFESNSSKSSSNVTVEVVDRLKWENGAATYGIDRLDTVFRFTFGVWDYREFDWRLTEIDGRGIVDDDNERARVLFWFKSEFMERNDVSENVYSSNNQWMNKARIGSCYNYSSLIVMAY